MLKLKLQYFGHPTRTANSLEQTLMLGKTEGKRRRGRQRMRWLDGITDSTDMNLGKLQDGEGQGDLACCSPGGHKESDTTELLNNNTLNNKNRLFFFQKISYCFLLFSRPHSPLSQPCPWIPSPAQLLRKPKKNNYSKRGAVCQKRLFG